VKAKFRRSNDAAFRLFWRMRSLDHITTSMQFKIVHYSWIQRTRFHPNVTTLRSGLCYRKSVCRLSVTLVHFGNISSPLCTLAILWPPCKILRRSSQENQSTRGV